jgi:hypothetical protein
MACAVKEQVYMEHGVSLFHSHILTLSSIHIPSFTP